MFPQICVFWGMGFLDCNEGITLCEGLKNLKKKLSGEEVK